MGIHVSHKLSCWTVPISHAHNFTILELDLLNLQNYGVTMYDTIQGVLYVLTVGWSAIRAKLKSIVEVTKNHAVIGQTRN